MRNKRTPRAARAEVTEHALVATATRLFTRQGYAKVTIRDLASAANVTSGALYHHFPDKLRLFRQVAEQITARLVETAAAAVAKQSDPWECLLAGIDAVLASSNTPEVKLAFLEAPVVLGLDAWRALEERHTGPLLTSAVTRLVDAGQLDARRAVAFASMLRGMMVEAAMSVAHAQHPEAVRVELSAVIRQMVSSLKPRTPPRT